MEDTRVTRKKTLNLEISERYIYCMDYFPLVIKTVSYCADN